MSLQIAPVVAAQRGYSSLFLQMAGYGLALVLFIFLSQDAYTMESRIVAWLLFVVGTLPAVQYFAKRRTHIPVVELILLAYVNAFSLPLFFQDQQKIMVKVLYPDVEPVTQCLLLALVAIVALWVGYKCAPILFKALKVPKLTLICEYRPLFYYASVLCILSIIRYLGLFSFLPDVLAKIILSQDLGIALLALLFYGGYLRRGQKLFVIFLMLVVVLNGIGSGMAEAIFRPLLIWYICRWVVTRKFEYSVILGGIVLLVLLQPVKLEYRAIVWSNPTQFSQSEKLEVFAGLFYNYWVEDRGTGVVESTYSRTSLLLQTAHVIDWTPSVVPYRNGETLYFMFVSLIPRFIWPDKPIAQQANIIYAIDYGITTLEGIKRTMFGVGTLGEAYMNLGVVGIMPIFLFLGLLSYLAVYLLSVPNTIMQSSGLDNLGKHIAPIALLIVNIINFVLIGSAIGDSYGGFIQLIIVQGILLRLFTGVKK